MRCCERGIALIRFLDPALRRRAIGGRERLQLTPRFAVVVSQRRRGDSCNNIAALVADRIGALDLDQFCGTRLQPLDTQLAAQLSVSIASDTSRTASW